MATESGGSIKPVAVVIVGADTLLAARPATPIQLWHACLAAGYDLAVPATWGDELIAAECLRAVGAHAEPVTVMCSCPMVARAMEEGDPDLADHLVSLVAPPVATARYLRRVYGDRRVHITYAGACPAAGDSAIDAWVTPPEMLERFADTGIDLATQPQLFESILPPDRRRHVSQPGGIPTPERAAALPRPRRVVEVDDIDVMGAIRRHRMAGAPMLVDVAPRFGCACSGVTTDVFSGDARLAVTLLEPPRSARPVMTEPVGLALLRRAAPRPVRPRPMVDAIGERPPAEGEHADSGKGKGRERIVATSRTASRSPLSWNLRERALPQPPTSTGRAETGHGASSRGWGAHKDVGDAEPPPEPQPSAVTPPTEAGGSSTATSDPVTAAAVRALESASGARDPDPDRVVASPGESARGPEGKGTPSVGRPTPPGGYWFIPERAPEETDSEVAREAPGVADAPHDGPPSHEQLDATAEPPAEPTAEIEVAEAVAVATPETDAERADSSEDVIAEIEAMFSSAAGASGGEPAPEPPERSRVEVPRDAVPPDRAWMIIMTIILLLAGGTLVRTIARRSAAEPSLAARPLLERVESTSAGSLQAADDSVSGDSAMRSNARIDAELPRPTTASQPPVVTRSSGSLGGGARRALRGAARPPLSTRDSVGADTNLARAPASARRDTVPAAPPVAPPSTPAAPTDSARTAQLARDAEIAAIRAEIARRSARLDSIGRAVGTLYAPPPPARPVPPSPASRPPPDGR